jgi:putative aldouronate transport system substrate-binding protein
VVVDENAVAKIFADTDAAKRYYKKLNEVNQLGLIDQETFVLSYDQYIAKLSSGRVIGSFDQRWNFLRAERALITDGKILRVFAPCPVTFDESIKDFYMDRPPVNVDRGYGISVNAKDPVRIIKLLEALYDERWQKLLQWGVEGEEYMVDDNGRFYRTQEQRDNYDDPAYRQANMALDFLGYLPKIEGTYSDGNASSPGLQPEEYLASLRPDHKALLDAYGYKTDGEFFSPPPENPPYYPAWSIPIEDGSAAQVANTKMDELAMKYLPKAILADPADFEAIWDEYMAELQKVDIKAYEDVVNAGIQSRIEKAKAFGNE